MFIEAAKTADSIKFSSNNRAIIIDDKIVIRPSRSSRLAVDLKE